MADMESQKFEDSFKQGFEQAEVSPSDGVWTNIELDLEKTDGGKVRRKLLFYKTLAAASLIFAMAVAGTGYYFLLVRDQQNLALSNPAPAKGGQEELAVDAGAKALSGIHAGDRVTSLSEDHSAVNKFRETADGSKSRQRAMGDAQATAPNNDGANTSDLSDASSLIALQNESVEPVSDAVPTVLDEPAGPPQLFTSGASSAQIQKEEEDPGALLLAQLALKEMEYAAMDKQENSRDKKERMWTSVGFAAGGFSAVNSSVSPSASNSILAGNSSTVPDKQAKASGVSYSFGINVGAKLSNRWILQGGVNYLTQSSDYVATNVVGNNNFATLKAESINELDHMQSADYNATSRLAPTSPYSVNNFVQFFSVPVQAGYLVLNKKFTVQLNAGVSTDLFLQNTITPEGGSLDKTTQGNGEDSPYRTLNFSGLMGTELSYRFGQRYRVALNPGLRYPLSSVYKSDIGIQSTPLTFDVGLRFRYIFH